MVVVCLYVCGFDVVFAGTCTCLITTKHSNIHTGQQDWRSGGKGSQGWSKLKSRPCCSSVGTDVRVVSI